MSGSSGGGSSSGKSQNPLERVIPLLMLLYDRSQNGVLRSEIWHSLPAYRVMDEPTFDRQFSRDQRSVKDAGFRIVSQPSEDSPTREHRYKLDTSTLSLEDLGLTADEYDVLFRARWVWQKNDLAKATERALGRLTSGEYEAGETDETTFSARLARVDKDVVELGESALEQGFVSFRYRKVGAQNLEQRTVRVWAVLMANSAWYVIGWDADRQAQRTFKVSRIHKGIQELEKLPRISGLTETQLLHDSARPADFDPDQMRAQLQDESDQDVAHVWVRSGTSPQLRMMSWATGESIGNTEWDAIDIPYTQEYRIIQLLTAATTDVMVDPALSPELAELVTAAWAKVAQVHSATHPAPPTDGLAPVKATRVRGKDTNTAIILDILRLIDEAGGMITGAEIRQRLALEKEQLATLLKKVNVVDFAESQAGFEIYIDYDEAEDTLSVYNEAVLPGRRPFSAHEALGLIGSLEAFRTMSGVSDEERALAASATGKILAQLPATATQTDETSHPVSPIYPALSSGSGVTSELSDTILDAIEDHRALLMEYYSPRGRTITERVIEPLRLFYSFNQVYVQAWCRHADALRSFRVDRIGALEVLDETFEPRLDASTLEPVVQGTQDEEDASDYVFWFAHSVVDRVEDFAPTHAATLADGSRVAKIQMVDDAAAIELAASGAGTIRLIEPSTLTATLEQAASAAAQQQRDQTPTNTRVS